MPDLSPPSQQPEAPPAVPPPSGRSTRGALTIVFLVVFIDLLGFGIVLPLLPLYAKDMLIPLLPGPEHRLLRGAALGGLMSVFSLMQFIFAPIWGRISDRNGRRPILLLGLVGSMVFYALFGIASEVAGLGRLAPGWPEGSLHWLASTGLSPPALGLALLFLARMGAGIAGATISTAQAVIADCTTPEARSRGM